MNKNRLAVGAAVFAAAVGMGGTSMAGAAPVANDIVDMTVAFDRMASEGGTTYCVFDATVTLSHKGAVHVELFAKDTNGANLAAENRELGVRPGTATVSEELWVASGQTASFGAELYKHQGPNRLILVEAYNVAGTTTCPPPAP